MARIEKNIYEQLLKALQDARKVNVITSYYGEKGRIGNELKKELTGNKDIFKNKPEICNQGNKTFFYEPVAGKDRLILLGGGHITLPLCEFAAKAGFSVTVVDDRPEFANGIRFPWASKVMCEGFGRALEKLEISDTDYVAVLTRGHRYDAECLRFLLKSYNPSYLGMIGSTRRVKGLFRMLEEEGYSRECIQKVCAPIGLYIGATLPEEIAVSILAQMILHKRKKDKHFITTDLDLNVITYLAELNEPSAVATVINTKGSTPRGAGAKMVVNRYGKVFGSIGGGCAEKEVINQAIQIIGTGEYAVVQLDLTGDIAEDEGMVCGGIMNILLEDFGG